jgi:peptide deformylase
MITVNVDVLRTKSLPFDGTPAELAALVEVLEFELSHSPVRNGVGLSAIQVNIPYRVSIIRSKTSTINLFNAKITKAEQPFTFKGEGCLSFPGQFVDTKRYNLVTVVNGDGQEYKYSGFDAVLVAHEIGHWEGDLYIDHKAEDTKA